MAKFKIVLVVIILSGFQWAQATMQALTPQELASTCYSGSPMLYSDACFGQTYSQQYPPVFPGVGNQHVNQGDQLSEIYALLNALQGGGGVVNSSQYSLGALLEGSATNSMLWQNSNPAGMTHNWQAPSFVGAVK